MFGGEPDAIAARLCLEAGLDPEQPADTRKLSRALLGTAPRTVRMRPEAQLVRVRDKWQIYLRRSLSDARRSWLIGHEIKEWDMWRQGQPGNDVRCDAVAAALVLPRATLERLRGEHGDSPAKIARAAVTSQSVALLRIGECTGRPVALVQPGRTRIRGSAHDWPQLAYGRVPTTRKVHPVRITDEPRRIGAMVRAG